jgi:phage replication O-like protein O
MRLPGKGFVRIPLNIFDHLLTLRLSATELRIVLWVIRKTLGWNRTFTEFTWYRIAADLELDRAGILRAGKNLLTHEILTIDDHKIALKEASASEEMCRRNGDETHRMTTIGDDSPHRNRRTSSPLFRRAIDSSKDKRRNIYATPAANSTALHPAGAAQPVAGKYDDISAI